MSRPPSKRSDSARAEAPLADRLPPHSVEAEQCVLGCILLSADAARECMPQCIETFKAGAEVFYEVRHKSIYDAMLAMDEKREAIEVITLLQRLKDRAGLEEVGGLHYLASLPDLVSSAAQLPTYATIVLEKYRLRRMVQVCIEGGRRAFESDGAPAQEVLNEIESKVLAVNREVNTTRTSTMREVVLRVIDQVETNHRRGVGLITGVGTHFSFFDKMTGGLQPGFNIIAGRPGSGKTALVMNIAERVGVDSRIPTYVVSAEMGADALGLRMICSRARIDARSIKTGFMAERDLQKFSKASGEIGAAPIVIDDDRSPAVETIRARLRRWVYEQRKALMAGGLKEEQIKLLAVVDYAQKLTTTNRDVMRSGSRDMFNHISKTLSDTAVELNIPMLVAAQLNRETGKGGSKKARKPTQDDLAEADGFTRDADLIGLLYQPEPEDDDQAAAWYRDKVFPTTLIIDKQRNGETGPCEFTFYKWCTRFEDAHRETTQETISEPHSETKQLGGDPTKNWPKGPEGFPRRGEGSEGGEETQGELE